MKEEPYSKHLSYITKLLELTKRPHAQDPNLSPEGKLLTLLLEESEENTRNDVIAAIGNGRLPPYALSDLVTYEKENPFGPTVTVPFRYDPAQGEVRAVAESVARFVTEQTKEPQEVIAASEETDYLGRRYYVKPQLQPEKNAQFNYPNYSVAKSSALGGITGTGGAVTVRQEKSCKHNKNTLDNYVQFIRQQSRRSL